jgi:hypothetical protein
MRSNQNPPGSVTRGVGDRTAGARSVGGQGAVGKLSMSQMPVEWLDSGSWRLPSGKALAEFALQAGFLAPLLFRADRARAGSQAVTTGSQAVTKTSEMGAGVAQARGKQFGKGDGR